MAKLKGLGKGLGALFQDSLEEYDQFTQEAVTTSINNTKADNTKTVEKIVEVEKIKLVSDGKPMELPIGEVYANPDQPRKHFDEVALNELADSIRIHGVVQPLVVTKRGDGYMIIAGERRFRASQIVGLKTVPAIIKQYSEQQIKEFALIENLQREDLNPMEAAEAINELMEKHSLTQEQVAERIGKSRSNIANLLRLLQLSPEITAFVRQGKLSSGHARCLITVSDPTRQLELANIAIEKQLSVRDLEKLSAACKPMKNKPAKKEGTSNVQLKELVVTMQRALGTKVSAIGNSKKGRISIDYFSADDIDRIYALMKKLSEMT